MLVYIPYAFKHHLDEDGTKETADWCMALGHCPLPLGRRQSHHPCGHRYG